MTIHVITKQHENPVEFASTSREAADEHLATLGPGGFSIHAVELDGAIGMDAYVGMLPTLAAFQQTGFPLTPEQSAAIAALAPGAIKTDALADTSISLGEAVGAIIDGADAVALRTERVIEGFNNHTMSEGLLGKSQPKGVLHGKRQARPKT